MMTKKTNNTPVGSSGAANDKMSLAGSAKTDTAAKSTNRTESKAATKETKKSTPKATTDQKVPPSDLNSTTEPHENDVLCGRGGSINNHIGNEKFRTLVNQKKRVYLTARFKREKRLIAASIVQAIRSMDPPGRFLSRDSRTNVWYDIGDVKARDKTSQALREGAPEIRKEMENDRQREMMTQQQQQNMSMYDGGEEEDDYGDEYTEINSGMSDLSRVTSAFSVPGGGQADDMILRSHSMTELEMQQQHNMSYKRGVQGNSMQQYHLLPSSLKKPHPASSNQGVMPSTGATWNRASGPTSNGQMPEQHMKQMHPNSGYRDQLRSGRSVHFDEDEHADRTIRSSNTADYGGPFPYRKHAPPVDHAMLTVAKSWDQFAPEQGNLPSPHKYSDPRKQPPFINDPAIAAAQMQAGYDSDTTAPLRHPISSNRASMRGSFEPDRGPYYGYDQPMSHSGATDPSDARPHPAISAHQQQRAKFHRRYQQGQNKANLKVATTHPDNKQYYASHSDRQNIFEQPYGTDDPPNAHLQKPHPMSANPQPSPVNYRSSRNESMPPPKPVPRHHASSFQQQRSALAQKKRLLWDQGESSKSPKGPPSSTSNPSPSWEAEMLRLAQGENNSNAAPPNQMPADYMQGVTRTPSTSQHEPSTDNAMVAVPVMSEGDQIMQDQLELQLKNDDPSNKQLVESRVENNDWSARLSCNALLHIPQDWAPSFFNRTNSFEQAEASLCGMELCSVGSLGGGSLCNVFIEDDPAKRNVEASKSMEKADRLKHQSSWGSGRNSFASGRSLISPFGSEIGSDGSLMSKSSDRGLEPLPLDDSTEPPQIFSTAFASEQPDHDFVWSWDGKGTE